MASSAYALWLKQREFKAVRVTTVEEPPESDVQDHSESFRTPIRKTKDDVTTATTKKRLRGDSEVALKVSALRSRKRQIEASEHSETNTKRRQSAPEGESRVVKRVKSPEQKYSKRRPILLEESSYWLAVQRFSQL